MSSAFPQGHAVVVGVGADLPNTVDDAVGLAKLLNDQTRCAYPENQVRILVGPEATRVNILAALDALAQTSTVQSTVLIYFSGHGYRVTSATGRCYYLIPQGCDLDRLPETAISGTEFADRLRAVPAQKLLVLLDCCYAGGLDPVKSPGLELAKGALPPEALDLLADGNGRALIASSRDDELSFAGKPYSAFTLALIEALCGVGVAKQDGYVRVTDLALYTHAMVSQRTKDRQHPVLNYEKADNFVIAYYAAGDAQAKELPFKEQPVIESEPGEFRGIDQRGQTVHGPQTNIGGSGHGQVLSGTFHGPVRTGGGDATQVHRGFYQPGWTVSGNVTQANRDVVIGGRDVNQAGGNVNQEGEAVARVFAELMERIKAMDAADRAMVQPVAEQARAQAQTIQQGDQGSGVQAKLERTLRGLLALTPEVARVSLAALADPAAGVAVAIQAVAKTVLSVTSCMSCGQVEQAFGGRLDFPLGHAGA